ncbi:hypothetical protein ACRW9N_07535 [Listeria aquatica]|uniref:Lipoprotein n=1 Tax=Listeria aquatica FSL S10-1188 TaxID=1265818 RepID=W7BE97_9LIST|nr:hypothetical protein [Listeria aquatica]EUJ21446.1 hypothetical protein MAQA_01847 [Listeria aquatica FSL S10-1188]
MKKKMMIAILGAGLIISGCGMGQADGEQAQAESTKEKRHSSERIG